MSLNNLRLLYLNIIMVIFFIFNMHFFFFILLIWRLSYIIRKECIIQQIIESHHRNINSEDQFYHDQDIDHSYWYNMFNEEAYLIYNCRFLFDFYGGTTTLSINSYYIINNVYNNIYNKLYINKEFLNDDFINYYFLDKIKFNYNLNFFVENLNYKKFNVINNNENIKLFIYKNKYYKYNKINNKNV